MDIFNPEYWKPNLDYIAKGNDTYLTFQKESHIFTFFGLILQCPAGVYKPTIFSSTVLASKAALIVSDRLKPKTILEIGSGSGAIGMLLKTPAKQVTLTDIAPQAVQTIRQNALNNRREVEVLESDLFSALVDRRFDLVIFNMPYVNKPITDAVELALCDPGGDLAKRFLEELPTHLTPEGRGLFTFSNLSSQETIQSALAGYDYRLEQVDYYHDLGVYRWVVLLQPRNTR